MSDFPSTLLRAMYVIDALLLIALTDKMANIQPLAKAFVILGSSSLFAWFSGEVNTASDAYVVNAFMALAPAVCTWSVLITCRPGTSRVPFAVAALATWLAAMCLPNDTAPVSIDALSISAPLWRLAAGAFWFGVWFVWAIVAAVGWVRFYKRPGNVAHIIAAMVGVSITTEPVTILGWATDASFFVLTRAVDLVLAVGVAMVATCALLKTRSS